MSDIKQRLRAYWYCSQRLDKLQEKYQIIRSRAEKMTPAYSLAPGGGGSQDSMADTVTMLADMERMKREECLKLMETMRDVQTLIDTLSDFRMRIVLVFHYIHFMDFHRVAEEMHYDYYHVIKLHGWALEELERKMPTIANSKSDKM